MNCTRVIRELADGWRPNGDERTSLASHLAGCARCQAARADLDAVGQALRALPVRALPKGFEAQLLRAARKTSPAQEKANSRFARRFVSVAIGACALGLVLWLSRRPGVQPIRSEPTKVSVDALLGVHAPRANSSTEVEKVQPARPHAETAAGEHQLITQTETRPSPPVTLKPGADVVVERPRMSPPSAPGSFSTERGISPPQGAGNTRTSSARTGEALSSASVPARVAVVQAAALPSPEASGQPWALHLSHSRFRPAEGERAGISVSPIPASSIRVDVYTRQGRAIRTIYAGMNAPSHLEWDGRADNGVDCAAGVYFVVVRVGQRVERGGVILER